MRKKLTYEDKVRWFVNNYYETGMEYEGMLKELKDENLNNFKWYDEIIKFPEYENDIEDNKKESDYAFNLNTLIGKQFKYNGKYGLSNWTDTVKKIYPRQIIHFDPPFKIIKPNSNGIVKKILDTKFIGVSYEFQVVSSRGGQVYDFKDCIFIDE